MPEPIESIEVQPSEDNGNIPIDSPELPPNPAPQEPVPATETKADPVVPTVEPKVELYELPDGRKVDGATLTREWKENFLPDYTRKSQALAQKERAGEQNITTKPTDPLADPEFVPQSYKELADAIRQSTLEEIDRKEQARILERQTLENNVATQINELKTVDPNLNENALFLHATKYGFRDLKLAHQNMTDMSKLIKDVKATTAKDIAKRNDPVSVSPGATGARLNPSNFETAAQYVRAISGNK